MANDDDGEGGGLEAVEADVLPVEVVVVVVEVRFVLDLELVRSFVSEIVLANPSKIKYWLNSQNDYTLRYYL